MIGYGIGGLAVIVATTIVLLYSRVSRTAGAVAAMFALLLLTVQWRAAASGVLHRWHDVPPPLGVLVIGSALVAIFGAFLPVGSRLIGATPLAAIVGLQGFRLPLELFMHQAAVDGVMPMQMSYSGWNFDIVTGASAIVLAWLLATGRAPRRLLVAWNLIGSVLLVTIMAIGIASTPTFGVFGPDRLNTWVADVPFVWLPATLVPAALWGHLLVWKALASRTLKLGRSD